jgi:hypothetical protein
MQIAVDRGWLRKDINVRALAYWQQAMFFGHTLLDISGEKDLHEEWNAIASFVLRSLLNDD